MENKRFLLVRRPIGTPVADDFRLDTAPTPDLVDGQFLIRNHYASLDPAMRGWMDDTPSYMPPIALGAPVRASTVGVVVESKAADFPVDQWVSGLNASKNIRWRWPVAFRRQLTSISFRRLPTFCRCWALSE